MQNPPIEHWSTVKCMLCYLHNIINYVLLTSSPSFIILSYSYCNWVSSLNDYKSTSGYCIFYGWQFNYLGSLKQQTVARSSTKAKYGALASIAIILQYVASLLQELGQPILCSPILWCDNLSEIYFIITPISTLDLNIWFFRSSGSKIVTCSIKLI